MRRSDLQLLPAATVVWALAVLGITVGAAAGIAGAAVIVSLALAAVMLLGGTRTAHAVFAHLGVMVLAGALLFPALQRHTAATEMLEDRSEEHTSELQSRGHLVCRLPLQKKKQYVT